MRDVADAYPIITGLQWNDAYGKYIVPVAERQAHNDHIKAEYIIPAICYLVAHYTSAAVSGGGGGSGGQVASESLLNWSVSYTTSSSAFATDSWGLRYLELVRLSNPAQRGVSELPDAMYRRDASRLPARFANNPRCRGAWEREHGIDL